MTDQKTRRALEALCDEWSTSDWGEGGLGYEYESGIAHIHHRVISRLKRKNPTRRSMLRLARRIDRGSMHHSLDDEYARGILDAARMLELAVL